MVAATGDHAGRRRGYAFSDSELRDRLLALAKRARLAQRPLAVTADQCHRFALIGQDPGGVKLPR
jgi:hypothetical protein